ncbi:MAG: patatin-like phospholipase family protein [Limnothrix sp. BL-A-16]|jgi:NTE family protein
MSSGNYKNLALQAGGVLGTAYVGVVQALSERGLLSKFERVAGASAGAIMGTLIALRFSAAEIEEIMVNLNLSEFTDPTSPINLVQNYGYYAGDVFYKWIQDIIARKLTTTATFADLVDAGFADLYIFGTDLTARGLREFSCRSTPDAQVAGAVRASMSIPFFFQAWQFPGGIPDNHYYVDGGLILPYPLWTFDYPPFISEDGYNEETLGVSLRTGFSPSGLEKSFDLKEYFESLFEAASSIRISSRNQERTITVDTLNLSPTDFNMSDENKMRLVKSGYDATVEFFKLKDELAVLSAA